MAKQNFKDPNGKDTVSIDECVLDNKFQTMRQGLKEFLK